MRGQTKKEEVLEDVKKWYLRLRGKVAPHAQVREKDEPIFKKAADRCIAHGMLPEDYVKMCWQYRSTPDFYAGTLAADIYTRWLDKWSAGRFNDLDMQYRVQINYLQCVLDTGRNVEEVLLDDRYNFKPWFRVYISDDPIPAVIEKYGELAADYNKLEKFVAFFKLKKFDMARVEK